MGIFHRTNYSVELMNTPTSKACLIITGNQPLANNRHPFHDKIVDALIDGEAVKSICYKFNVKRSIVDGIARRYTKVVRVRTYDPGENQKSFFDVWKLLKPFRRP